MLIIHMVDFPSHSISDTYIKVYVVLELFSLYDIYSVFIWFNSV